MSNLKLYTCNSYVLLFSRKRNDESLELSTQGKSYSRVVYF